MNCVSSSMAPARRRFPPEWASLTTCSSFSANTDSLTSSSRRKVISRSTRITRSRMSAWPSAKPCARRSATRRGFAVTDGVSCRWTTRWPASPSTAAGVHTLPMRHRRKRGRSGIFPSSCSRSFSAPSPCRGGLNLHVALLDGRDTHHMAEAVFKGVARALDQATRIDPRVEGVPSTKGQL